MKHAAFFALLLPSLLQVCLTAEAQQGGFFMRADSLLAQRYYGSLSDTAYVSRSSMRWRLKGKLQVSTQSLASQGSYGDISFASNLSTEASFRTGITASYLGLSASLSINPLRLDGRNSERELNINYYGRRFGAEFAADIDHAPTGWIRRGTQDEGESEPIALHNMRLTSTTCNLYYVFNHRRFSYPAALNQSYIQRRSAGSVLAGVSLGNIVLRLGDSTLGERGYRFTHLRIGLGVGYGFNFVPARNWLFHISALPSIVVGSSGRYSVDGQRVPLDRRHAQFSIVGRGAIVYSSNRLFFGFTHVFNFSNTDAVGVSLHNLRSRMELCVGVRL